MRKAEEGAAVAGKQHKSGGSGSPEPDEVTAVTQVGDESTAVMPEAVGSPRPS